MWESSTRARLSPSPKESWRPSDCSSGCATICRRCTVSIYRTDLAYVHHVGFGSFAREAAPGMVEVLEGGGIVDGLVVDLGCGSGILARHLTDRGYDVLGVDISPAMISIARRTAPMARFRVDSLLQTPIPQCKAVTSLGEGLNYRPTGARQPAPLKRFFQRVYHALVPGGLFMFDVIVRPPHPSARRSSSWRSGSDWAAGVAADVGANGRSIERTITVFRKIGARYRRSEETHRVDVLDKSMVGHQLRAAGFRVRNLPRYGQLELLPSRVVIIARRGR